MNRVRLLIMATAMSCFFTAQSYALQTNDSGAHNQFGSEITPVEISTFVDDLDAASSCLAIDQQGNLYHGDWGARWNGIKSVNSDSQVFKIQPDGYVTEFVRLHQKHNASGVVIDPKGNLFLVSGKANLVFKFAPSGKLEGTSNKKLKEPTGIALDSDGNLFICNLYDRGKSGGPGGFIVKMTPAGESTIFCESKLLNQPIGIVCAKDNTLYVSNSSDGKVIKISTEGEASELATIGTGLSPEGRGNGYLALFEDSLYVVSRHEHRVYKVSIGGTVSEFVGIGKRGNKNGAPEDCSFSIPMGIAISPDGKAMYLSEVATTDSDVNVLGPTRIRKIELGRKSVEQPES
ncbi:MAG: sugar lactone lactonase YvrE [Mariniblastus sp.]|jgi:sugar lactone lactonase YvrE